MPHRLIKPAGVAAILLALATPVFALSEGERAALARTVDYIADHGISVVQSSDGGTLVVLETNLDHDIGAALHVVLGKDGIVVPEADLGPLAKITGLQVLKAPASVDVGQFDTLHVMDRDTNSVIGVAPLR